MNIHQFFKKNKVDLRSIEDFLQLYPTHEIKIRNLPLDTSIKELENTIIGIFETIEITPDPLNVIRPTLEVVILNLRTQIQELKALNLIHSFFFKSNKMNELFYDNEFGEFFRQRNSLMTNYHNLQRYVQAGNVRKVRNILADANFVDAFSRGNLDMIIMLTLIEEEIIKNPLNPAPVEIRDAFMNRVNPSLEVINGARFLIACQTGNIEVLQELINMPIVRRDLMSRAVDKSKSLEVVEYLISQGFNFKLTLLGYASEDVLIFLYNYYLPEIAQHTLESLFDNALKFEYNNFVQILMHNLNLNVNREFEIFKRHADEDAENEELDYLELEPQNFDVVEDFLMLYPTHEIKVRNLPLNISISELETTIDGMFDTITSTPDPLDIIRPTLEVVILNLRAQIQELESLKL